MILKGKVINASTDWSQIRLAKDGSYIVVPFVLRVDQHVEIEIKPIEARGAGVGSGPMWLTPREV